MELVFKRRLLAGLRYELLYNPNRCIAITLSSYAGRAVYLPVWHEILIMIDISSIMIHDELWYRHVRVGDVGKSGPPMTGGPNSVGRGVNQDRGPRPIGKSNWGEINSVSQGVNRDEEPRPIGKSNWVRDEMGPLGPLGPFGAYIRKAPSFPSHNSTPPPKERERESSPPGERGSASDPESCTDRVWHLDCETAGHSRRWFDRGLLARPT